MSEHIEDVPVRRGGFFRLTLNFALGAATVLIVTAAVIIRTHDAGLHEQLAEVATENNADLARTFATTVWRPHRAHIAAARQRGPDVVRALPETAALARDVAEHARGLTILKVNFYDAGGFTAFSTDPNQIGADYGRNPRFLAALAGASEATLEFRKTFGALQGPVANRWMLSISVPIRASWPDGPVEGVAEVYRDVTTLVGMIEASKRRNDLLTIVALIGTFIALVFFVWSFHHIMRGEHAANLRLAAGISRLKAANEAKNEFLAHMSHELRTPLIAIIGFSELIRDEIRGPIGNPDYKSYIVDICNSGRHLLRMIEDVLDLVKAENSETQVEARMLDLDDAARRAVGALAATLEKSGHKVEILTMGAPRPVETDPDKLHRILVNLLSNAIKFSPPGSRINIAIDQRPEHDTAIRVVDRGIGMSEDEILIARTPFGQVESVFARSHQGTGLGLPLCQKLAELLGGSLDIESVPGDGTTVTLTLPDRFAASDGGPRQAAVGDNDAPPQPSRIRMAG